MLSDIVLKTLNLYLERTAFFGFKLKKLSLQKEISVKENIKMRYPQ